MKKEEKPEKVEKPAPVISPALQAMLAEQRVLLGGKDLYSVRDAAKMVVGIELPAFSLMYLCGSNIIPFSKIIMFAGPPQSYKSALMYFFQGMIATAPPGDGNALLVETEGGKYSVTLIRSLMTPLVTDNILQLVTVPTVEEAQNKITQTLKLYDNPKFKNVPTAIGLDSLTGNVTDEKYKQIDKEGHAEQDYARTAILWSDYLRKVSSTLVGLPVILFVTNHLKDKIGARIPGQKTTPGGQGQYFHSTLYFYITKTGGSERKTYMLNGERLDREQRIRSIEVQCKKSSWGEDGVKVAVDMVWYFNERDEQVTYFDWETSTVELLLAHQTKVKASNPKVKLSDLCDITVQRSSNLTLYKSERMKLEDVESHELGAAIHADKALMGELMELFHIPKYRVWDGKMPDATKLSKLSDPQLQQPSAPPVLPSAERAEPTEPSKGGIGFFDPK